MSNSYRTLIERLRLFANGHFLIQRFFHGQLDAADIEKEPAYPFMHVLPIDITPQAGYIDYQLEVRFADIGRDKEDKTDYQKEIISDCTRLALDLISEIENGRVLFGRDAEILNKSATIQPFIEELTHVLTGVVLSVTIRLPYNWSSCEIPADYSPLVIDNPSIGGGLLTKIGVYSDGEFVGYASSIDFDTSFTITMVGGKASIVFNGGGGGLTCSDLPNCDTIIHIEANIDTIEGDITTIEGSITTIEGDITNIQGDIADINTALDGKEDVGVAQSIMDAHEAAADPHPQYLQSADLDGYVPYTGATQYVNLGDNGLITDSVEFDTTPTVQARPARMVWNDTDGTLEFGLKGGNVTLQIGQEEVVRVVNGTGATLEEANYQAVKVVGAQGQRLQVELAQADTDLNSATTIGIVTETIYKNEEGFVTTNGLVREIDTTGTLQSETWNDGDVLYLSPTTAGAITNVKPTSPEHMVVIGYVVYAHANHGKIFVKVDNGYELEELHNVLITSPKDKQILEYDESVGVWKNTSQFNYSINFKDVVQHEVILPYNWKISSIGSNPSAASVTIEVNGSAYSFGDTINANTDVITIDTDIAAFINLICDLA